MKTDSIIQKENAVFFAVVANCIYKFCKKINENIFSGIFAANTAIGFVLGLIASFFLIRNQTASGGDYGKAAKPK